MIRTRHFILHLILFNYFLVCMFIAGVSVVWKRTVIYTVVNLVNYMTVYHSEIAKEPSLIEGLFGLS